jgi:hypothetical protein
LVQPISQQGNVALAAKSTSGAGHNSGSQKRGTCGSVGGMYLPATHKLGEGGGWARAVKLKVKMERHRKTINKI